MNEKELNEIELEQVSGGKGTGYASDENLPADHGVHISEWEAKNYINQEVYFVNDGNTRMYGYGTLVNSIPKEGHDYYIHTVLVEFSSGNFNSSSGQVSVNKNATFRSNAWTLYKKNN